MSPTRSINLHTLTRKELVDLAKSNGIRANSKSEEIIAALSELDLNSFDDSFDNDEKKDQQGDEALGTKGDVVEGNGGSEEVRKEARPDETHDEEKEASAANTSSPSCVATNGEASADAKSTANASNVDSLKGNQPNEKALGAAERSEAKEKIMHGKGQDDVDEASFLPNNLSEETQATSASTVTNTSNIVLTVPKTKPKKKKSSAPAWKVASRDFRHKHKQPQQQHPSSSHSAKQPQAAAFGHGLSPTKSRIQPVVKEETIPAFKANTKKQKELPLSPRNFSLQEKRRIAKAAARNEVADAPERLDPKTKAAFGHAATETHSRVQPDTTKIPVEPFKANTKKIKELPMSPREVGQKKFQMRRELTHGEANKGANKTKAAFGHGVETTRSRIPLDGRKTNGASTPKSAMGDDADASSAASSVSSGNSAPGANKKKTVPAWKVASRDFRRKHQHHPNHAGSAQDPATPAAFGHGLAQTKSRVQPTVKKENIQPFRANTKKLKAMEMTERNRKLMEEKAKKMELAREKRAQKVRPEFTRE